MLGFGQGCKKGATASARLRPPAPRLPPSPVLVPRLPSAIAKPVPVTVGTHWGLSPCHGEHPAPRCLFPILVPGCRCPRRPLAGSPWKQLRAGAPVHSGAEARGILSRCSPFNPPLSGDRAGFVHGTGSPARRSAGGSGDACPQVPAQLLRSLQRRRGSRVGTAGLGAPECSPGPALRILYQGAGAAGVFLLRWRTRGDLGDPRALPGRFGEAWWLRY